MRIDNEIVKKLVTIPLGPERTKRLVAHCGDFKTLVTSRLSHKFRVSTRRLRTYKNKHLGEKCFIIGNGPSLKKMDLSALRHEKTFGLNRIYLLFGELGFATTYYVSVNRYVISQCVDEIGGIPCPKFLSWNARRLVPFTSDTVFIRSRSGPRFCVDIAREGIWEGATVTYVAMQIAYWMGFQQVILIGVDHAFQTKGVPHQLVTSHGDDPDHFQSGYFGRGFQWQLPDLETSAFAYGLAKRQFELSGREILDATVGGKLQVFQKLDYAELMDSRSSHELGTPSRSSRG
jgi:hypothetical protein